MFDNNDTAGMYALDNLLSMKLRTFLRGVGLGAVLGVTVGAATVGIVWKMIPTTVVQAGPGKPMPPAGDVQPGPRDIVPDEGRKGVIAGPGELTR